MIKAYVDYQDYANVCNIYIIDQIDDGNFYPLEYKDKEWIRGESLSYGAYNPNPTIVIRGRLTDQIIKALVEAFDNHGIKPNSQSNLEGQLKSTKYHLEDMRKIAFKRVR